MAGDHGIFLTRRPARLDGNSQAEGKRGHLRLLRRAGLYLLAQGWHQLIGDGGITISLEHYGASADAKRLFKEFGFSVEAIIARVKAAL